MTQPGVPPPEPDPEAQVEAYVQQFLHRLEEGESVEVDEFCAAVPEAIRAVVRSRCIDIRYLKRVLPQLGAEGALDVSTGRQLGDFRLLREIGRGAMGVVYLARQISLDRLVAVKVLPPHVAMTERQVERFRREALSSAKLQHPHIVPIHAVSEVDGMHFFAMEYIPGGSLNAELELLRARRKGQRPGAEPGRLELFGNGVGPAQVAAIGAAVADALDYAHRHGIIHRDVKPHNVLLGDGLHPFLVDFGLAKDLGEASLSRPGDVAGTPFYMSPEQAMAKRVKIDHRTDVFSLGVVLYEMLTLQRPFGGKTSQQIFYEITFLDPPPIRSLNPRVPKDLQTICLKAMEKSPDRRYATAGELAADLRRFLGHESILARPPSPIELGWRKLVRHRLATVATGTACVALVVGMWIEGGRERQRVLASDLAPLRALSADLEQRPAAELVLARESVLRVRARDGQLGADDAALLDDLERRIRAVGTELARRGRELRDVVIPSPGSGERASRFDRYGALLQALSLLGQASALLPDDAELARLADVANALPHMRFTGFPPGTELGLRSLMARDGRTGPYQPLGAAPLADVSVPPGFYRVVVVQPGVGHAELARFLDEPGRVYEITAADVPVRPTAEAKAGMVLVPAGEFVRGHPERPDAVEREERLTLPAFWIDPYEVTNAQYREFLRATNRSDPTEYLGEDYDPVWDDLPVARIERADALAYAEWAGKRLPTRHEFERAARGNDGRIRPWGNEPDFDGRVRMGLPLGRRDQYLAGVTPVGSLARGISPDGIANTMDNLHEWSESIVRTAAEGEIELLADQDLLMGGSYIHEPSSWHLSNSIKVSAKVTNRRSWIFGFRCAKSVEP
jgi:serine/threonine protein kinase/formylglycine-generating enzyme required for sulfatase activity